MVLGELLIFICLICIVLHMDNRIDKLKSKIESLEQRLTKKD